MSIFTSVKKRYQRITAKQFILTGVFMLALAAAIGGGFASKEHSLAASARDCDTNSIDYKPHNGGCGALDPVEFIADARQNDPGDLQAIYADERFANLPGGKYDRFASTAQMGFVYRNGEVKVDGETVMTDAWSMGRKSWGNPNREPVTINGSTYYTSTTQNSFASGVDSIPVMVMFDAEGTAESIIMTACGNPVWGNKVKSSAKCKALNMTPVANEKNTYEFTTNITLEGHAKVVKVEYLADGEEFSEQTDPTKPVKKTFNKSATVTVKVTVSLPGNPTKVISTELCKKKVGVVKEEFLYVCDALIATARDNTNRKFRFTVQTKQSNNVTVDSADFTLDSKVTTKGVTTEDTKGDIYKDYDFSDNVQHTVSVIVNFTADGKKVTSKVGDCVAKVTPEKAPECPEKPGSGLPPGHPDCKPKEPPVELPKTGAGSVAGLFAGISVAGAIGHRVFMSRRARRS